ncbi:MAG: GGGtGRT protein [Christensenellales bacterium]
MVINFENYASKRQTIDTFLAKHGVDTLENALAICTEAGIDVFSIVKGIQPICYADACWAYTAGTAAALKAGNIKAADAARIIGQGLQAFCLAGSVAEQRKVGLGHGELAAMVLSENVMCFAFVAGHESFAAAEGAIGIALSANKVRKTPIRVILNGMGKDAAEIISRFNGFTHVETDFDFESDRLTIVNETRYSEGERGNVRCYGANEMREGVAIMEYEKVDVSITGNATHMIRFQHPVCGTYKKITTQKGKKYFACASGGGIGRTLNPDDTSAGPSSYGQTDLMSRMYADAVFAGSSSVPAHVAMMGFIGMGNNPMVGATVSLAVAVQQHGMIG